MVLADAWVRYFMVTPPPAARSPSDCRAAAGLRFTQLYGTSPDAWTIRADWHADLPFLACALPTALLDHLESATSDSGLRLLSLQPQFIAAFNAWRTLDNRATWFAVSHQYQLVLGLLAHGRLSAVRQLALPMPGTLTDALRREALRMQLPMPRRLRWLGDAHPDRCDGIEFLDMRAALPDASAGTILAATGAT